MFYRYECEKCNKVTEIQCSISEMKREIKCGFCDGVAKKVIEAPTLVGVSSTKTAINKELRKNNEIAGKKMKGSHRSMKTGKY